MYNQLYLSESGAQMFARWVVDDREQFEGVKRSFRTFFRDATWDAARGCWTLPGWHIAPVCAWSALVARDVVWEQPSAGAESHDRARGTQRPQDMRIDAAYDQLCLTPDAPAGLVDAVHRWWVKQVHPDTGGTHEAAVAINAAADLIRRHASPGKHSA